MRANCSQKSGQKLKTLAFESQKILTLLFSFAAAFAVAIAIEVVVAVAFAFL